MAWIDAAVRAWPDSAGKKNGVMFVAGPKDCALGDERVRVSDFEFRWSGAGYGPVDPAADDAFVHRCDLSMSRPVDDVPHGRAAGEVVLTRYHDVAALRAGIASFRSQTDTPVQDNDMAQVTSGRYTVDTLHRWYPTNPQGLSQAVVVDEQQLAMVSLGVNSLSREDFETISAQKIADALADFLERSHAAGPARPAAVPAWGGSVWEDPQERYRIAIAKGWTQAPAAGEADDPGAVAHLVDADRSASVVVVSTPKRLPTSSANRT
jgi:hypothetical protein